MLTACLSRLVNSSQNFSHLVREDLDTWISYLIANALFERGDSRPASSVIELRF